MKRATVSKRALSRTSLGKDPNEQIDTSLIRWIIFNPQRWRTV